MPNIFAYNINNVSGLYQDGHILALFQNLNLCANIWMGCWFDCLAELFVWFYGMSTPVGLF